MATISFTSPCAELDAATDYRFDGGQTLPIIARERCPACGGTIRIGAQEGTLERWATFVRCHLQCVQRVVEQS